MNSVTWALTTLLLLSPTAALAAPAPAAAVDPHMSLSQELLAMQREDQEVRKASNAERQRLVDRKNLARLKEIVARFGWPLASKVGPDGAEAAWILAQHADADPAFQRRCLTLLEEAAAREEAELAHVAYLTDRVLVNEGKPQLYGTQFWGQGEQFGPRPIADEYQLDQRRQAMGLGPFAESPAPMDMPRPAAAPLRAELLAMQAKLQADPAAEGLDEDRRRLEAILKQHGWPSPSLVGLDGAQAALAFVLDSNDAALLRQAVPLIEAASRRGEAGKSDWARLVDKLRAREGKRQLYGTALSLDKNGKPHPGQIEDEAHLDERRASVDLPPLSEKQDEPKRPAPKRQL